MKFFVLRVQKYHYILYLYFYHGDLHPLVISPPDRVGRHIVFPRASVRPSVCPSQIVSAL